MRRLFIAVFAVVLAQYDDSFTSPAPFGSAQEAPSGVGETGLWDDGWFNDECWWCASPYDEEEDDEDDDDDE